MLFDAGDADAYTTVYRLEAANGQGPYESGALARAQAYIGRQAPAQVRNDWEWEETATKRTLPEYDFTEEEWAKLSARDRKKFLFGFYSPAYARAWFGPVHLKVLKQFGVTLVKREARKVIMSKSWGQLIFIPYEEPKPAKKRRA